MSTKQVCAWCNKEIGIADTEIHEIDQISHGICPDCYDIQIKEIENSEISRNKN